MERIIDHWTAGTGRASRTDKDHYHRLTEHDGRTVLGNETIADNIVTSDGDYAAHTLNLNTKSIGVAMCGMSGAKENPFDAGDYPLNETQFEAHCEMIAGLCLEYDIAVSPTTVLTHAEVEGNLGVKQRGKWDYTRLPWRPDLRGARACGDYMRERVSHYLGKNPDRIIVDKPTLRLGDYGPFVKDLQVILQALGYPVGAIDSDYGTATEGAVLKFQAAEGLVRDGVAGTNTWRRLYIAGREKRRSPLVQARAGLTIADVRRRGSRIVKGSDKAQAAVVTSILTGAVGKYTEQASEDPIGAAETVSRDLDRVRDLGFFDQALPWLQSNWYWIVIGLLGFYIFAQLTMVKKHRTEDTLEGKHLG